MIMKKTAATKAGIIVKKEHRALLRQHHQRVAAVLRSRITRQHNDESQTSNGETLSLSRGI